MHRPSDETSRLLGYLLAIYEFTFGFLIADGVFTLHGTARPLLRGSLVFLLAGIGFHYFVNLRNIDPAEYKRKSRTLWIGILFLLGGISLAGFISLDAFMNHVFLLLFMLYIVMNFLFYGALRDVFGAGSAVYGLLRIIPVYGGAVVAGKVLFDDFGRQTLFIMAIYFIFHIICEFLRRSASVKSTRLSVILGFIMMLTLLTFMFYQFAVTLDDIKSKLLVMALVMILLVLVSLPPLYAIRTMKALPLYSIFPKGLAGSVVLTLTFFVFLKKPLSLLLLMVIPLLIIGLDHIFVKYEEDESDEIKT